MLEDKLSYLHVQTIKTLIPNYWEEIWNIKLALRIIWQPHIHLLRPFMIDSTKLELYWQELEGDIKLRIRHIMFYLRIMLINNLKYYLKTIGCITWADRSSVYIPLATQGIEKSKNGSVLRESSRIAWKPRTYSEL